MRWMRQSLVGQFMQLQHGCLGDVRPGVIVDKNWPLHFDRSRAHTSEFLAQLADLLAVPPHRSRLARIQKAVMDEIDSRPSNSHHNLFR